EAAAVARSPATAGDGDDRDVPLGPCPGDDDFADPGVLRQYELVQKLGHGQFAVVWHAVEKRSRQAVALKKLYAALETPRRAQMAYREIAVLEKLQGHPNIVELRHVLQASESLTEIDVYLVFGLWEADLHAAIRGRVLETKHLAFITCQVLRALAHMHQLGFVHRDVKPSNILINTRCKVKLCDFGHARSLAALDEPASHNNTAGSQTTDYTGSRWYRAPESLLGTTRVTEAVDLWGLGCVLAEMLQGEPVFPGNSTSHQLGLIVQVTGRPTHEEVESLGISSAAAQLDERVLGDVEPQALSQKFSKATAESLDFIRMCLQFVPGQRTSAKDALAHPYLIEYFHEGLEALEPEPPQGLFLDDNILFGIDEYKHMISKNIAQRVKAMRKRNTQDFD
ncbi:Extracellular signal-regulated kinase 2 (ERK2) (Defective in aggregation protein C) (MAP kinase 2), partial [Durusdinium trenchii]